MKKAKIIKHLQETEKTLRDNLRIEEEVLGYKDPLAYINRAKWRLISDLLKDMGIEQLEPIEYRD